MKKLYLYSVFHLNLSYSAIAEAQYPAVIEKCYRPLLDICENTGVPLGIEASGSTLEKIFELAPDFILKLKNLIKDGKIEFVGSGYSQIIGPLVPAKVIDYNLKIGNGVYREILGYEPGIAFIYEQAYSQGLIEHYLGAGYKAIVMEWNNPYRFHSEWQKEWQCHPQIALSQQGLEIPIIWNNSISFQKFQRYAQGEIELDEYLSYLKSQINSEERFFPFYGSDAEVFDFRPGRYKEEAEIAAKGEWTRINNLFQEIVRNPDFEVVLPSKVLESRHSANSFNRISLESAEQPIPVKKQEKYNPVRWALTGRDNLVNNTKCYKIYNYLAQSKETDINSWKELCFLWGSDFRTHIEEKKYLDFQKRLNQFVARINKFSEPEAGKKSLFKPFPVSIEKEGRFLKIETKKVKLVLNCKKGMAIEHLTFKDISTQPLIATLSHGYYDDISLGADFYSGNTIIEIPGKRKITDLAPVDPVYPKPFFNLEKIPITGEVMLGDLGKVCKKIAVFQIENRVDLQYEFEFADLPLCTLHSGIITLNPRVFNAENLRYSCHNGGKDEEFFFLKGKRVAHNDPVSSLISAKGVLGSTDGLLKVGDGKTTVNLKVDMAKLAILPMINFINSDPDVFLRVLFSLREIDETAKPGAGKIKFGFHISITA
jgi:Glycosyl hydrolase family 57